MEVKEKLQSFGHPHRYLMPESLRKKARDYYRDLSRGANVTEFIIRDIFSDYDDVRVENFSRSTRHVGPFLASVGIHPCSGCGADPERHESEYKTQCKQCNGSSWMHEVRKETPDENAPPDILAFAVKFIPGKFDGHEDGWHPVWWELCIKENLG